MGAIFFISGASPHGYPRNIFCWHIAGRSLQSAVHLSFCKAMCICVNSGVVDRFSWYAEEETTRQGTGMSMGWMLKRIFR
eukprot:c34537_g1_i1 orf=85-324(+)